jgi:hypothetical protein
MPLSVSAIRLLSTDGKYRGFLVQNLASKEKFKVRFITDEPG